MVYQRYLRINGYMAIASGLIFGFLHVMGSSNPLEYLYIIPYGSLGFFFALTCYETNNIYPSICMHAIHNSALIILSIFTFKKNTS